MSPAALTARRRAARAVRWLIAAALGGLAVTAAAAAQAQAAGPAAAARTGAASSAPQPIPVNTQNWSASAGFGSRPPAWYLDGSGVVHLQGAAKQINASGEDGTLIGILPPAATPPVAAVFTIAHAFNGNYADLQVDSNGQIFLLGSRPPAVTDFSFVSLEGITYRPAGHGNPIALNTADWSGNAGAGARSPGWYKDGSGVVHLQGAVHQVSTGGPGANVIGTLPPAAAPSWTIYTVVITDPGTYADLAIEPDGTIALIDPRSPAVRDEGFVSLESISYRPNSFNNAIAVNTSNWSATAGFGSRAPAWYKDKNGIVHLEGAATQTSASGTGANLIGTLPPAARPGHEVYTIVHTFNGTYADLAIAPNGRIGVIAPRAPLVTDYTFVSLESISYRR
jgi:hypothetical protein